MSGPLAGLRVLELARILAGPWCGQLLADLGADVVKVEAPEGDDTRGWGPPFVPAEGGGHLGAAYFHAANRGKRSVVADFRTEEGRALVRRLASRADVVIENFKVGGLAKHGLDPASLRALNPRLVVASITGFGQDGPDAHRAGYDFMIQGIGGLMSLTGQPGGPPTKVGVAVADLFAGLYAAVGVLAALRRRDGGGEEGRGTGRGAHVDVALLDVQLAMLANQAMNRLVSGADPGRLGNAHPNIVPYEVFPASDGHVILAVGNDGQFERAMLALDAPALASDPRFATNPARVAARATLVPLIAAATLRFTRAELLARFEAAGVPAGPINTAGEALAEPQAVARGMRIDVPHPGAAGGSVPGVRTPLGIDGERAANRRAAPVLGGDGGDVAELEWEWRSQDDSAETQPVEEAEGFRPCP